MIYSEGNIMIKYLIDLILSCKIFESNLSEASEARPT